MTRFLEGLEPFIFCRCLAFLIRIVARNCWVTWSKPRRLEF